MNKEHLPPALCKALGIEAHEHHAAAPRAEALDQGEMQWHSQARAQALAKGDHDRALAPGVNTTISITSCALRRSARCFTDQRRS
jgi:hypothetical protein